MRTLDQIIYDQIGDFALLSLGARDFSPLLHGDGLAFTINAPALAVDGTRERSPRRMDATVTLDINDTYIVEISYADGDTRKVHFRASQVYAYDLENIMIGIDRGTLHGDHGAHLSL